MKRMLLLLWVLLLPVIPALADQAEDIAQAVHPGCVIEQRLGADGITLLVLGQGSEHVLMLLDGSTVVVDNPYALFPGDVLPRWSFTSETVSWTYQLGDEQLRYHADCVNGVWGAVDVTVTGGETARIIYDENGLLHQISMKNSERSVLTPIMAPWLDSEIALPFFRADGLPIDLTDLPMEAYQWMSFQLLDGMNVIAAKNQPGGLLLLCEKPNQVGLVLAACEWQEGAGCYRVTRSSTITTACEVVPGDLLTLRIMGCDYAIGKTGEGGWGILGMTLPDAVLCLNADRLYTADAARADTLWGTHPWKNIASINWNSLPRSEAEAYTQFDPSGWAMVANPEALDTLHLRSQPDIKAYSLGCYYTGTPVQVLSSSKDWMQVSVGGVTGWMMKQYLALDHAMRTVPASLPVKRTVNDPDGVNLYADARGAEVAAVLDGNTRLTVLGFVSDRWYHVLVNDTWQYGYVAQTAVQ